MPINFPNNPLDLDTYSPGTGTIWQYSLSNNSWTVISSPNAGVDNGTDYDNTIVTLNNVGGSPTKNLQVAAVGLKYDPAVRNLILTALSSHATNLLTINDNANLELNAFNQRGVLKKAGMIFFQGSAPTGLNAADVGQLWLDTTTASPRQLKIWNGTTFEEVGGGVTLNTTQTITGAKTFSSEIVGSSGLTFATALTSSATTLNIRNTVSGSPVNRIEISGTEVTIPNSTTLNFTNIGSDVKTNLVTVGDAQTISGQKTLQKDLVIVNNQTSISNIVTSTNTTSAEATKDISLRPNLSASGRAITIHTNSNTTTTDGIIIKATQDNNLGRLNVIGDTRFQGNIDLTGNITPAKNASTTNGSANLSTPITTINFWQVPRPIGTLTFSYNITSSIPTQMVISNSSSSAVGIIYTRRSLTGATTPITNFVRKEYRTVPANGSLTVTLTDNLIIGMNVTTPYGITDVNNHTIYATGNSPSTLVPLEIEISLAS